MIVVQNHIPVKEEYRKQFEDTLSSRESFLTKFEGFVRNDVLRPVMGDHYIVMSVWDSMQDFNAWIESEEFRKAHENTLSRDAFSGESFVTIHDIFHSVVK